MKLNIQVLVKTMHKTRMKLSFFFLKSRGSVRSFDVMHVQIFMHQNILWAIIFYWKWSKTMAVTGNFKNKTLTGKELNVICISFISLNLSLRYRHLYWHWLLKKKKNQYRSTTNCGWLLTMTLLLSVLSMVTLRPLMLTFTCWMEETCESPFLSFCTSTANSESNPELSQTFDKT